MSSTRLEKRVTALEKELARLKNRMKGAGASEPWWQQIAGTFEQDPAYEKARKLGRQYRQSQRPNAPEKGK